MEFVLWALFAFVLTLVLWLNPFRLVRRRLIYRAIPTPNSLKCHWLLGHLPDLRNYKEYLRKRLKDLETDNPGLQKIFVGPFVYVSIVHPKHLPAIFKEPKSSDYDVLHPWLGEGLLTSKGKKWFRNRRLLTPAFHYSILKNYASVYNSCVSLLSRKWLKYSESRKPVKVFQDISSMSLDIIFQCAFSFQSDCQVAEKRHPYVEACCQLTKQCTDRFINPLYTYEWIYWRTAHGRKMKMLCKTVHDHAEQVVMKRRAVLAGQSENLNGSDKKHFDFLDILLMARDEEGRGMSDSEIRNEVDTFMFEGHDTTTSGMSWTLYCLAQHPQHQEKIREEVRSVLKGRECLEYENLKHLNYTTWCIKEAMRLYPPVYSITRANSKELHLGEYIIPKHTKIPISVFQIHRNPAVWENPSKFDPLRFQPGNIEKHGPYDYIPFSAGSRNCIGQNFAMNEMKVVIGLIVNQFELEMDESHNVEIHGALILKAENDIQLNLRIVD